MNLQKKTKVGTLMAGYKPDREVYPVCWLTKIILEPYTTVYVDAYSRKWYRPVTRTYITDTVVNNRILLRSVTGDVPAGWVNILNSNVERR